MILHFLFMVISFLVLCYVVFGLYLYFFQHRFVYHPEKKILLTPEFLQLDYEDISFESLDGTKLHGWFVPLKENPKGAVLFCHGNAGNIGDRLETIKKVHAFGFHIFIFDYRGFGQSAGKVSEPGTYLDTEAAWHYLIKVKGFTPQQILLWGRSLGAAIASRLAVTHTPRALIVESGFSSVQLLGKDLYPFFPVAYLSRFHYKTAENLKRVKCPVLVIHSREDKLIPFHHGQYNFESASQPKEFVEITGDHGDGFLTSGPKYDDGIRTFLEKYF